MSSLFKSKRSNADATKSSSKSSNPTEPDPKTQKNASSAPSSKSGAVPCPSPVSAGAGEAATNSKPNTQPRDQKASPEMQKWLDTDCPVDTRIMATTVQNNTLSISRSGRFKAKGKMRARLFSEDPDSGSQDGQPNQAARCSGSLATPEDRQTVLEAMAKRTGATTTSSRSPTTTRSSSGVNPSKPESGASKKSTDREVSSKWSTTTRSMDL